MKKMGFLWKHFIILMSFVFAMILCVTIFIYHNAINVMEEELCDVNMNRAAQLESDLVGLIEQTDHLAASLCVQQSTMGFWGMEDPENLEEEYYKHIRSQLKGYVYSMNNYISSIVLYAPHFNRVIDQDMAHPINLSRTESDNQIDVDWIANLEEITSGKVKNTLILRAINDSYPYVLTLIKQYKSGNQYSVVAIDIDLEKAYSSIIPDAVEDTSVWVMNEDGQVIIRERKQELSIDNSEFSELALFNGQKEDVSSIYVGENIPIVYTQRYNDEYGMFVVAVRQLVDFDDQMWHARITTALTGFFCVLLSILLVLAYVKFVNKPLSYILGSVQEHETVYEFNEKELADYIVSSMQMNTNLKKELEHRVGLLNKTQLQVLKAQINPHFLFNTLNAIVMMIDAESENSIAAELTTNLAGVLQYSLSNDDLVRLEDELSHTRKYVYILEHRYKGRFLTKYEIDPALFNAEVPKLILQPLIENAVFHGIAASDATCNGVLTISAKKELINFGADDIWGVHIEISDNGIGMSPKTIDRVNLSLEDENISMEHIGIQNVAKRLHLLFPSRSKVEIQSTPDKGTTIKLLFPFAQYE